MAFFPLEEDVSRGGVSEPPDAGPNGVADVAYDVSAESSARGLTFALRCRRARGLAEPQLSRTARRSPTAPGPLACDPGGPLAPGGRHAGDHARGPAHAVPTVPHRR